MVGTMTGGYLAHNEGGFQVGAKERTAPSC